MTVLGSFQTTYITGRLGRVLNAAAVIFGVIGTALGIYAGFFYERKPVITFEVLSQATVFDIREDLSKLNIIYDGQNLNANNKTLSVISLRVVNNGQGDMLLNYYDEHDPIGFKLHDASLVEKPIVLTTSNSYLQSKMQLDMKSAQLVTFTPAIIEAKEFFVVKLLLLHGKGTMPRVEPIGKVAGSTSKIEVVEPFREEQVGSTMAVAFQGGVLVQIVRGIAYVFGSVVVVVGLAFAMMTIEERRDKKKRTFLAQEFKDTYKGEIDLIASKLFDAYINNGAFYLEQVESFMEEMNSKELRKFLTGSLRDVPKSLKKQLREYSEIGIVRLSDNEIHFHPESMKMAKSFIRFARKHS